MFQSVQNKRMKYILLIMCLILLIVLLRVFWVQVVEYKKLNKLANELWSRNLPVQADRGRILDRNGKVIADNVTTASLILIPNQIRDKELVAKTLSEILGHKNPTVTLNRYAHSLMEHKTEMMNRIGKLL